MNPVIENKLKGLEDKLKFTEKQLELIRLAISARHVDITSDTRLSSYADKILQIGSNLSEILDIEGVKNHLAIFDEIIGLFGDSCEVILMKNSEYRSDDEGLKIEVVESQSLEDISRSTISPLGEYRLDNEGAIAEGIETGTISDHIIYEKILKEMSENE